MVVGGRVAKRVKRRPASAAAQSHVHAMANTDVPRTFHVQKLWWRLIADGSKTIEGRCGPPKKYPCVGSVVAFVGSDGLYAGGAKLLVYKKWFPTLEEYLEDCWERAALRCRSLEEAREAYMQVKLPNGELVFKEERVKEKGGITALFLS